MEQLLDMKQLKKLTPEQQSQVLTGLKQQAALVNAQNLVTSFSEKCSTKCITAPGSYLSDREKQCVQRCMDRFVESWSIVSITLQRRLLQQETSGHSEASSGSVSPSLSGSSLGMFGGSGGSVQSSGDYGASPTFS